MVAARERTAIEMTHAVLLTGDRKRIKRSALSGQGEGRVTPAPERQERGEIGTVELSVQDVHGASGFPFRALSTLDQMLSRETIDQPMYQAGDKFHEDFITAHYEAVRASDMMRVTGGGRSPQLSMAQIDARDTVWEALLTLGGQASPCGVCAWFVLGLEWSIQDWATRGGWANRPINRTAATGILIGTLGALQRYYGL